MENWYLTQTEKEAIHGTMHRLEKRWNILPIPDNSIWHAYDPLPFWDFLNGVREATELTEGRRFLDVGCGIGTKLSIMKSLGWDVFGIEHHLPYVNAAKELVPEATIYYSDILDWDDFDTDFLYMYRPARQDDLEIKVENWVMSKINSGTVCFFPNRRWPEVWVNQ